ncbi:hypothetical protein HOLleu_22215 [Holothuria leucospilota]|uniref:Uncharacterized protein n=1 Tax=Holothuria leucospilota TaxID=206669 RepID=A0A9Q1H7C6_HOLLE|nr:hypothetical protein HOLleu_22215 [Holothuria leucospilota]
MIIPSIEFWTTYCTYCSYCCKVVHCKYCNLSFVRDVQNFFKGGSVTRRPVRNTGLNPIDERVESSREFNFNAAFLELSRSENCLRYVPIIAATWQHS